MADSPVSGQNIIHGKHTVHGHLAHYIDEGGASHAAIIKMIKPADNGRFLADLHVFHNSNGGTNHVPNVPYDARGGPRTWNHLPTEAEAALTQEERAEDQKVAEEKEAVKPAPTPLFQAPGQEA